MRFILLSLLIPFTATAQDGGIPDSAPCENCCVVLPDFDAWATTQVDAGDAGRRKRRRPDGGSTALAPAGGCECGGTSADWLALLGAVAFLRRRK
jgi:hypothetical protein